MLNLKKFMDFLIGSALDRLKGGTSVKSSNGDIEINISVKLK